jgi:peptidoglycan/LPS O-acetylase OafA/YrhL
LVDKGQRKRTADVAEKLGVGLLLAIMAQGIFAEKLSAATYGIGAVVLAIAIFFIVLAIYLSKEG